ncbi:hypothetical protein SEA_ATUIN_237 [Arthrobacter phage Atuin]|nr:hypothetical protein SEA_ATUIN_36 [Arthrobacter phage Atuin]
MTSDLLQILEDHQPVPKLFENGPHTLYLECHGRGCFFVTRGGELMRAEFAQHQWSELVRAGFPEVADAPVD